MLPLPVGSSWAQAPGVYVVSGVSGAFWDARCRHLSYGKIRHFPPSG